MSSPPSRPRKKNKRWIWCCSTWASTPHSPTIFLISSARNPRQSQAICDEIEHELARAGCKTKHLEGYHQGEWILMDYGFLVVHIFSEKARGFYDLERLWRTARKVAREEAH